MAAETVATGVSDPSVDGTLVAWHVPGQPGVLVNGDQQIRVGGTHPALGGGRLAVFNNGVINVQQTVGQPFAAAVPAPGADAIAVSADFVAWRAHGDDGDTIYAAPLAGGGPRRIAKAKELGRPALEGARLAYHVNGRTGSRIVIADAATGKRTTVRRERRALLLNPSLQGGRLLYVRNYYKRQELRIGPQSTRAGRRSDRADVVDRPHRPARRRARAGQEASPARLADERLWPRPKPGLSATLWTTALGAEVAYVTLAAPARGPAAAVDDPARAAASGSGP